MTVERHPIISRSQWLSLRLNDVTASDIGAVCGVDPRRTPLAVFAEKAGLTPGKAETAIMRRGRYFEPAIIEALRDQHPSWHIAYPLGMYLRDPERRIGATPDAIAIDPAREGSGVVQGKVIAKSVFEREWSEGPPLHYQLQTLTEAMLVDGSNTVIQPIWAILAALVVSEFEAELHIVPVERNPGAEKRICDEVEGFWKLVAEGRQPRADYRRDGAILDAVHRDTVEEIDLTGDNDMPTLVDGYLTLTDTIGEFREQQAEIANRLKEKLGSAAVARVAGGRKVMWKTQHRKEHIVKEWSGRVLRVYGGKE